MQKGKLITAEQVYMEIVNKMNRKDEFCTRLDGSKYIPKNADELPPILKKKDGRPYKSAYNAIWNRIQAAKNNKKVKHPKAILNKQMKNYKSVAKTGRVELNTFINLVNEYRQVLDLKKSTLTPNGAIEMHWEAKS